MRKKIKKIVLLIFPIALGVFLVWWSISRLSGTDKQEILNAFQNVNYFWIFVSLFLGLLSHLSRALRWKYLLAPLGYKPRFLNSVFTIFTAYLINLAVPRAGEVVRASGISKYESIPFEKALGTIVAERIIDVIMLLLIIIVAFFYQFELIMEFTFNKIPNSSINIYYLSAIIILLLIVFFIFIKRSEKGFFKRIRQFIIGLFEGIKSVYTMEKKRYFIAHTLFIWMMYLLMFYTVALALPETSNMGVGTVITGFVVGSLSIATTNGGLGTYPLGVQQVLVLYSIASNPALAFGWLIWSTQTFMVLLLGGLSFLALPIYNRKFLE